MSVSATWRGVSSASIETALQTRIEAMEEEIERLRAQNADLLEALSGILESVSFATSVGARAYLKPEHIARGHAAIAKANGTPDA